MFDLHLLPHQPNFMYKLNRFTRDECPLMFANLQRWITERFDTNMGNPDADEDK